MKIFLIILILKSFLHANSELLPESTVAVVNGIAISEDELDKAVSAILPRSYFHATVNEEKLASVKKEAMELLIQDTILYSYAISKKINIPEDEVDKIIEEFEGTYGSESKMLQVLKNSNFTLEEFKLAVRKNLVLKKLHEQEIESNFTDKMLKKYYDENKYKFKEPEKIKVSLIYVRNDPTDPNGQIKAKKRMQEAVDMLEGGENFAFVAQTYSDDMTRVTGGDMGYLHRGRLDPEVEEVAFNLNNGDTSKIIEKDIGCYLVRVVDKTKPNQLSFDDVKEKLKKDLKQKEEGTKKADLLEKLMSNAVIIK